MGNYRPAPQHTSDKNSVPRAVQSPQCVVQDHDHGGEARAADNEPEKILRSLIEAFIPVHPPQCRQLSPALSTEARSY
jgi:hypothetical protein